MMTSSARVFLLFIAITARHAFAVTVGNAVASLCPDIQARLAQNTVLGAVVNVLKDADIGDLPANVVVVAPSDAAFVATIEALGTTAEAFLSDPELLAAVLTLHLGGAAATDATELGTIAGPAMTLTADGKTIALADAAEATEVTVGGSTVGVEEVIVSCPGQTAIFADAVLLPTPEAAGPTPAPTPAPTPVPGPATQTQTLTVGDVVASLCPAITDVLKTSDFSILLGLLTNPPTLKVEIILPTDKELVIAAPTNAAFEALLAKVDPATAANTTIIFELLANHIGLADSTTSEDAMTLYPGGMLKFWVGANPATLAGLAAAAEGTGAIQDADATETAVVAAAVACADVRQYAFAVDTVLVPKVYQNAIAPSPTPINGPNATPSPAPKSPSPPASPAVIADSVAPPPPLETTSSSSAPIGAIVGGVVAGVVVAGAVVGAIVWQRKKKHRRNGDASLQEPPADLEIAESRVMVVPTAFPNESAAISKGSGPSGDPGLRALPPTLPEGSMLLSSLSTMRHSTDPVLEWISSRPPALSLRRTVSAEDKQVPDHIKSLEFTWASGSDTVRVLKPLGLGSFGKVFLGEVHHTPVALKLLVDARALNEASATGALNSAQSVAMASRDDLVAEVSVMASLRHPNVALLVGFCMDPPAIAIEYCSKGSLFDVLKKGREDAQAASELTWQRRLLMAADAASGMLHLHTRQPQIIHRDLKTPNLLVDPSWAIKVADMGLSKIASEATRNSIATVGGASNPRWIAPEVIKGDRAIAESDVFSFGVCMWELLTWRLPWEDVNPFTIPVKVVGGERLQLPPLPELPGFGPEMPMASLEAYIALMRRCWAQDPQDRPSFGEIAAELRRMT